jgi:hypothetical protein
MDLQSFIGCERIRPTIRHFVKGESDTNGDTWENHGNFTPRREQFTPANPQFVPDSFRFDPFRVKIIYVGESLG